MKKYLFGLCATALVCTEISAQRGQTDSTRLQKLDEVVVSDSRFALKRENSGKTVIKIDALEMERNQGKSVAEIINTKSGLEIAGSRGREGTVFGAFARGGRGRQVLVLIDGVRVNDPSSFSSGYDMRLLSTADVESIEIIKGASSTLYGSNAATAVISITTKMASKKKIAGDFQSSVATNQTADDQNYNASSFANSAQVSGTLDRFTYFAGFSNNYSDGLSAVVTTDNEQDDFSRFATNLRLGYRFSTDFKLGFTGNQTKLRTEFDEASGFFDTDYEYFSIQERIGLNAELTYKNGSLQLNSAYSGYIGENFSNFPSTFQGKNYVIDIYNKYNYMDKWYTVLGLNYIQDQAELAVNEEFTIIDPYVNVVYVSDFGLNVNAGVRLNNHSEYGNNLVYSINPSYSMKTASGYLKFMGSYATSYITPNLIQLFGEFGANPDLEPEEDRTIEAGAEYAASEKLRFSALYFNRKEENFITFDQAFKSVNAEDTIDAQGAELELDWIPTDALRFNANYTFTERKGDDAVRIPKHKINSAIFYQIYFGTDVSLSYQYTGERPDILYPPFPEPQEKRTLESFSILDFQVSQVFIPETLTLFLSVNNLLNESFIEVIGFTTRGRNVRLGLRLKL